MKAYRIKSQFASFLTGLNGLYIIPSESRDYVNVYAFAQRAASDVNARDRLSSLPENCDRELIYAILKQIQFGIASCESAKILREYLQCAEKKDRNNEIRLDIKEGLKKIFLGLLLMVVGGVGSFVLLALLMSLSPAVASWMSLPLLLAVSIAISGVLTAGAGCLRLAIGIFSFCFRQKNTEQLPGLENALYRAYFQPTPLPPSYQEVVENKTLASAPVLHSELPTYQQAIKNMSTLPTNSATSSSYIPALVSLPSHSAHFFHHPHRVSHHVVNDNPPSVYYRQL